MSWKPKDIITETWSIYRSSGKDPSRSNFYDFTLSIIAWQILEQDNTIAGKDAAYSLHIVIQRIIQTKDTSLLEKALLYWDGVLQQQERITATPGLLSLDPHTILNIPHPLLSDLLSMWADYFGDTSKQAPDSFISLLEVIEEQESIARV
ncbi:hypothetical protein [Niabella hibiscisoli]|uniref:hypothetical protein n=1 Tax=Niabella hibiscisoli TaxID=1825928 RepID=UPI001F0F4896|nr:hypothetical protein [Niabella hibiscisoli]MCH5719895.1 hypothetical protein [Niabella hibiscisoli]